LIVRGRGDAREPARVAALLPDVLFELAAGAQSDLNGARLRRIGRRLLEQKARTAA
jgi:hypothetical protein